MNIPQTKADGKAPSKKTFPTLLALLRDLRYYYLVRALLNGDIQKLLISGPQYFTYRLGGDEVLVSDENLAAVVGSIKTALGFKRLRLISQRSLNGGLVVLSLSPAAKKALLLELVAHLAHLSSADLANAPDPLDVQLALQANGEHRTREDRRNAAAPRAGAGA